MQCDWWYWWVWGERWNNFVKWLRKFFYLSLSRIIAFVTNVVFVFIGFQYFERFVEVCKKNWLCFQFSGYPLKIENSSKKAHDYCAFVIPGAGGPTVNNELCLHCCNVCYLLIESDNDRNNFRNNRPQPVIKVFFFSFFFALLLLFFSFPFPLALFFFCFFSKFE